MRSPAEVPDSTIDTTRHSLLLWLCLPRDRRARLSPARYICVYAGAVLVCYGVPALYALLTQDVLLKPQGKIALPFFLDLNAATIGLFSTPLLLVFALRESTVLTTALRELSSANVLPLDTPTLIKHKAWVERACGTTNLVSQIVGIVIGALACEFIWRPVAMTEHGRTWQTVGVGEGSLAPLGYMFVLLIVVPFFCLLAQFFIREVLIVIFLHRLAATTGLRVNVFHHDMLGGLRPIARIGLFYQRMVWVIGIQVSSLIVTLTLISGKPFHTPIGGVVFLAYTLLAPVAFAAPLWPFRRYMIAEKMARLRPLADHYQAEWARAMGRLDAGQASGKDFDLLDRIGSLHRAVLSFPEWPFDASTMRKFGATYVSPLVWTFVSAVLGKWISDNLLSGS